MATCSSCGTPAESQTKIDELENHVRVLTQQSANALDRLAGYEEEIRQLRIQRSAVAATTPPDSQHNYNTSFDSSASVNSFSLNRFASFRMARTPSFASSTAGQDVGDLQSQLAKEQAARVEAEKNAAQLNSELEDLSVTLFEQANEMVATERKARSKLEDRIATLEQRDKDKTRRLAKIEGALDRLERVRVLLAPPSPPIE